MGTLGLCTVRLHSDTGLPRDDVENTFHFTALDVPSVAEDVAAAAWNFYAASATPYGGGASNPLAQFMSAELNGGAAIRVYDLADPSPRAPVYSSDPTGLSLAAAAYPQELALCLSYRGELVSGLDPARRRGRIYVGPFGSASVFSGSGSSRPAAAIINQILGSAIAFDDAMTTAGATWVVYSSADATPVDIVELWVDNAWDIQRRRGVAATARTVAPL